MNYQRIWILLRINLRKTLKIHRLVLLLFLGIISVFLFEWDGQNILVFKIPIYTLDNNKEKSLESIFHELFSWAWLFVAISDLLPRLLSPLSNSFLVNQMLWLRLTPCLPIEVAIARVLWVISWAILLGILGVIWVLFIIFYHQFFPKTLFLDVGGLISYIIFAGGIVIACLDFGFIIDSFGRIFISVFALFSPIIFFIFYSLWLDTKFTKFLPIVLPFSMNMPDRSIHFSVSLFIGSFLLLIHLVRNLDIYKLVKDR